MEQVKTKRSPSLEEEAAAEITCGELMVAPILCPPVPWHGVMIKLL